MRISRAFHWRGMRRGLLAATACLTAAGAAYAHHSFAAFDQTKEYQLSGTVKEWQWTNPHTIHVIVAPDKDGKLIEYTFEGYSPSVWRKNNVLRDTVHVGDKITLKYYPRRDGVPGGQIGDLLSVNDKHIELPEKYAK